MPPDVADSDPVRGVEGQAPVHEVVDFVREGDAGDGELANLGGLLVGEGDFAGDENGEEDAEGPDLGRRRLVLLAAEDLRRRKGRRAVETCWRADESAFRSGKKGEQRDLRE